MSPKKPPAEDQAGWIDEKMKDPEFRRAVQEELAVRGFVAQVKRALEAQGVPLVSLPQELARRLGWPEAQVARLIFKHPAEMTVMQASRIAHALGFRLRIGMEP